ncbi:phosphoenolpyruvate synthase [bacterium]|nr:phosphoenolpyruvate synthase [bacterium]
MKSILWFKDITLEDVPSVGGKNASLGEMIGALKKEGVTVPDGFAITAAAYFDFLKKGKIKDKIEKTLSEIDVKNVRNLHRRSKQIRDLILKTPFPLNLEKEILESYQKLSEEYGEKSTDVAVRSSATAEDLPGASFAGLHETYLNIRGEKNLLLAVKRCMASLFTPRAISYREEKGFNHMKVALSVGVQKMVRSDLGCSGVMFTLDTESGFPDVVLINGTWGLGEMIVQGKIIPDEFLVAKKLLLKGYPAIIRKELGTKRKKMIYAKRRDKVTTKIVNVPSQDQRKFTLSDNEILKLAEWGVKVERHYSKRAGRHQPMDLEWAKDGKSGGLFLIQARPETVHGARERKSLIEYRLEGKGKILTKGISIGEKIGQGRANIIKDVKEIGKFKKGEILVTKITDPDWEPIMKIASGIVTDSGGRTCHAAIISRELGIPCIVGTKNGTEVISQNQEITIDCSKGEEGFVYKGKIPFKKIEHRLDEIPKTKTRVCLNIGSPDIAFRSSFLPVDGIGLAREEFIFASEIRVHPLALLNFEKLDKKTKKEIEKITAPWKDKKQFFVEKLAQGISRIATAFYPREVIVRFSDFKSNEYAQLIGGDKFEPKEPNPMIGWRGASRYYSEEFKEAFLLECKAIKKAREEYGLKNIVPMVPFCRTVEEGKKVLLLMKKAGLERGKNDLKVYVMCEIPSNVILAKEFLKIFDGFSIGSNDLTQLTLGLDRDNAIIAHVGNERNEAVKRLIREAIKECRKQKKYSGICGDAPSTFPEFTRFLIDCGIESISVNPDVAVRTKLLVAEQERKIKRGKNM